MLRRLLDLRDPLRRGRRRVAHRLDDVGGDAAGGRVRLEHQGLDPAPQLVLVLVAPDPAHLGERVALDHAGTACHCSARRATGTSSRRASVIMEGLPGGDDRQRRHPLADASRAAPPGWRRRPAAGPAPRPRRPRPTGRSASTCRRRRRWRPRRRAARAARSRSRERAMAKARSATRCPHTSGSACTPCVRPTLIVSRCFSPWSRSAATRRSALASSTSVASVSCTASAVSSRSDDVMPWCTYAAAERGVGVVRPRGEEGDDVVLRRLLDLRDPLRGRRRGVAHRLDDVGGHPPRGGVRLEHERLDPAPERVLVLVAPDPAHLGERVALDHRGYRLPLAQLVAPRGHPPAGLA